VTDPQVKPEDRKEGALKLALAQAREYAPEEKRERRSVFTEISRESGNPEAVSLRGI